MRILLLNGPNMNMLGIRKPEIYGTQTLSDLERLASDYAAERGVNLVCAQSNHEGALIDALHRAHGGFDGVVYNPGAHAHYSYALRDAVEAIDVPVIEVHMTDTQSREDFRAVDVIASACAGQVVGLGFDSYLRAIDMLIAGKKA